MSGTAIPLAVDPTAQAGPNIGAVINQANAITGLQANQQALAGTNALKGILGNPGNMDPATGLPKANAMAQIAGADPDAWLRLQQAQKDTAARAAQMQKYAMDRHFQLQEISEPIRVAALDAYKKAKDTGADEATAQAAGQAIFTPMRDELLGSGVLSDTEKQQLPVRFDPANAWANSDKWQAIQKTRQEEADRQEQLAIQRKAAEGKPQAKWTVETDPTKKDADGNPIQFRYNPETAEATTLDGKQPYTPGGIAKVGGQPVPGSIAANRAAIADDVAHDPQFKDKPRGEQAQEIETRLKMAQGTMGTPEAVQDLAQGIASYQFAPLSGFSMARPEGQRVMAEVKKLNPDYQEARYPEINRAMTAFGSGKQGDTVRYINNAIQHIDVMQKASDALKNGDMQTFNSLMQRLNQEFGVSAPTTFDGLKQIVGTEIERAATGGVGAAVDRDRLMESMQRYNSPAQLSGAFDGFRSLFKGQANSLKNQYEDATGFKSGPFAFDNKLLPETKKALGLGGVEKGAAATPATGATPAWTNLPPDKRTAALDYLKAHPETKDHFVTMFGAGAVPGEAAAPVATPAAADPLAAAKAAIAKGAPRDKVIERLKAAGIATEGL